MIFFILLYFWMGQFEMVGRLAKSFELTVLTDDEGGPRGSPMARGRRVRVMVTILWEISTLAPLVGRIGTSCWTTRAGPTT